MVKASAFFTERAKKGDGGGQKLRHGLVLGITSLESRSVNPKYQVSYCFRRDSQQPLQPRTSPPTSTIIYTRKSQPLIRRHETVARPAWDCCGRYGTLCTHLVLCKVNMNVSETARTRTALSATACVYLCISTLRQQQQ